MGRTFPLFVTVLGAWSIADAKYPVPPLQTDAQKDVLAYWRPVAAAASARALPEVLRLLDSPDLRSALESCCPDVAGLDAKALLDRIMDEVRSAEYAHGFGVWDHPDHNPIGWFNLDLGEEYRFLLNSHQAEVAMRNKTDLPKDELQSVDPTLNAEEYLFKLPPFQNISKPTWDEASTRLVYVAQNWRRLSFGSHPIYGEATLVLVNDYIKDTILASPVDTGSWEVVCNHTEPNTWHLRIDCKPWNPQLLGTWNHFYHVFLKNLQSWRVARDINSTVRIPLQEFFHSFFGRSPLGQGYPNIPKLPLEQSVSYWETNVVANVRFPEGVRFVIADFDSLFGASRGLKVQSFARKFGWGLVWARTEFVQQEMKQPQPFDSKELFSLTGRFLDPSPELTKYLNITISDGTIDGFQSAWAIAHRVRTKQEGNATRGQITEWWHKLSATQIELAPATATRCGGIASRCVGYRLPSSASSSKPSSEDKEDSSTSKKSLEDGDCVCYRERPPITAEASLVV